MKINYSVSDMSELTSLPTGRLESGGLDKPGGTAAETGPWVWGRLRPRTGCGESGPHCHSRRCPAPSARAGGQGPLRLGWTHVASAVEARRAEADTAPAPGHLSDLLLAVSTALGKGQDAEEWGAPSGDGRGSHKPPRGVVSVIHLHTWPKFTERLGSRADSGLTARLGGRVRRCRPGRAAHGGRGRPQVGCKRPWA